MATRRSRGAVRRAAGRGGRAGVGPIAVDIGNSETVLGVFRGERLDRLWRLSSSGRRTADELSLELEAVLRAGGVRGAPRGGVLCSVVPALTTAWATALERVTGIPPFEVASATVPELPIRYHDRAVVGADRIANAIAARARHGTPAIVVDLGTATTFDCISHTGAYLGGAISPGVGLAAEALFQRAARLPRVELRTPRRALGRNTEESLQAGVLWGAAGTVDALVRRLTREMKGDPRVIATGGWAHVVAPECETVTAVDEGLTLEGLRLIWEAHS